MADFQTAQAEPAPAEAAEPRPLGPGDHVFLVDGSSFVFRAYFQSINQDAKYNYRSDGLPTGALRLFCTKLYQFEREGAFGIRPTHMAIVFDKTEQTFRKEIYADYKATRKDPPDDLKPQFPLMREAVRAFGLEPIEKEGYEADDVIATYACEAAAAGAEVLIISSDKDMMQLVSPNILLYDFESGAKGRPGYRPERKIDRDGVIDYFGLPPEKVVDVQALVGDTSDNVPGVPGIGVKTAAQLLTEFGDLETLLARAGEIKQPKRRESLITYADQARISRRLVELDTHVALDVPLAALRVPPPDPARIMAFSKAMEFTTLTKRVAEASGIDPDRVPADPRLKAGRPGSAPSPEALAVAAAAPAPAHGAGQAELFPVPAAEPKRPRDDHAPLAAIRALPYAGGAARHDDGTVPVFTPAMLAAARRAEAAAAIDHGAYRTVADRDGLAALIARAEETGLLAVEVIASSADPMRADITGMSFATAPGEAFYLPLGHRASDDLLAGGGLTPGQLPAGEALAALRPLLEAPHVLKLGHDLKRHVLVLARHGIRLAPFDDILLVSYVLDAGLGSHGLTELAAGHLGHAALSRAELTGKGRAQVAFERLEIGRACPYCAELAEMILRLWRVLRPRLVAERLDTVYETLERPLVPVLAAMEREGVAVDRAMLARLSADFAQTSARLEDEIFALAGERFNLGSPKQLGDILFGRMGLPGAEKTATGAWSTRAGVLEDLAEEGHPLPQKILDWRQVSKLRSTYTDALPGYINPETRRVHTSYALAATTTGRLSSSEPNLQNIPVRTEEGRKIRRAFVPEPGNRIISADYSQIELRLLTEVADVPNLREAFRAGTDIHALTASEMFGVPVEGMPADVRRRAKAINFGIIYGISAFGLANQLGIPREEAGAYIKKYFERFPGIRDYMEETKAFARETGYVTTLFGRKMSYPEIRAKNMAVRTFNERAAINARLQGTAADIIRRAMIRMPAALAAAGLSSVRMLLQVHDELVFEAPEADAERAMPVIRAVMEKAPEPAIKLAVPLRVDAHAADNWEAAH